MTTRAKTFSQFAKFVEPETGELSAEVSGLDSAAVTGLIDSDYVSLRASASGEGVSTGKSIAMSIVFGG